MSKTRKNKKGSLDELLEEFFPDSDENKIVIGHIKGAEEVPEPVRSTASGDAEEAPEAPEPEETAEPEETEEITESDAPEEDIEVPVDILEEEEPEVTEDSVRPEVTEVAEPAEESEVAEEPEVTEVAEVPEPEDTAEPEVAEPAETPEPAEPEENPEPEEKPNFFVRILRGLIPWKGDSAGEIIRKIIFLIAIIVFIGAGVMLISTLVQSRAATKDKENVQSVITTTAATTVDAEGNTVTVAPTEEEVAEHNFNVAEYFKGLNEDYVGYLEVEGCDIYEPVMQYEDNEYYLTHNYYGGTNKGGTVFMDWRCQYTDEYVSPNIILYGHNQEDGTMFGNLKKYKMDCAFYAENPVIKFSTENETSVYIIYGYFVTNTLEKHDSNGVVFRYWDYIETLNDEATFNWYMDMIQQRNQIVCPVDVRFGDQLLCLSTCSNEFSESRFIVLARKLREGENLEDIDFGNTYLNPNAKGVDWAAVNSGTSSVTSDTTVTEVTSDTESEETSETTKRGIQGIMEDFLPSGVTLPTKTESSENSGTETEVTTKKKTETTTAATETTTTSETTGTAETTGTDGTDETSGTVTADTSTDTTS